MLLLDGVRLRHYQAKGVKESTFRAFELARERLGGRTPPAVH